MKLIPYPSNEVFAKRIKVFIEGTNVATITCDGCVQFAEFYDFGPEQLRQILYIAENFNLFYQNIKAA
jgi:hypothetical protein